MLYIPKVGLLSFSGSCQLVIFSPTCKQEGFGGWHLTRKEKKGEQEGHSSFSLTIYQWNA